MATLIDHLKTQLTEVLGATSDSSISAANKKRFFQFLNKLIRDPITIESADGPARKIQVPAAIILQIAKEITQGNCGDEVSALEKAFNLERSRNLQASLNSPENILNIADNVLDQTTGSSQDSDYKLLEAIFDLSIARSQGDPKKFEAIFGEELKNQKANFSQEDITTLRNNIKAVKLDSYSLSIMSAHHSDILELKSVIDYQRSAPISLEDKQKAKDLLQAFQDSVQKDSSPQNRQKAKAQLLNELDQAGDGAKKCFAELCDRYNQLNQFDPENFINGIKESLPGLIMPGLFGIMAAYLLGIPAGFGGLGAVALALLGDIDKPQESKVTLAKPPASKSRNDTPATTAA
jgi:hypothetical protein